MRPTDPRWKMAKRKFPKGAIPAQIIEKAAEALSNDLIGAARRFRQESEEKVFEFTQLLSDLSGGLPKDPQVARAMNALRSVCFPSETAIGNAVLDVDDAAVAATKGLLIRLASDEGGE